jgi:hypothetical protein
MEAKKGRDVKGARDVKLSIGLVRGREVRRKRHAREKFD